MMKTLVPCEIHSLGARRFYVMGWKYLNGFPILFGDEAMSQECHSFKEWHSWDTQDQ